VQFGVVSGADEIVVVDPVACMSGEAGEDPGRRRA
jgi:hypothetical protein